MKFEANCAFNYVRSTTALLLFVGTLGRLLVVNPKQAGFIPLDHHPLPLSRTEIKTRAVPRPLAARSPNGLPEDQRRRPPSRSARLLSPPRRPLLPPARPLQPRRRLRLQRPLFQRRPKTSAGTRRRRARRCGPSERGRGSAGGGSARRGGPLPPLSRRPGFVRRGPRALDRRPAGVRAVDVQPEFRHSTGRPWAFVPLLVVVFFEW